MNPRTASFLYKAGETALLLLAFAVPTAFYLRAYDAVLVKTTAVQVGVLAVAAAWALKGLARGRWELSAAARPLLLPALALAAWTTVRFLAEPYKLAALDGFLRDLAGLAIYCMVLAEFGSQENARRLTGWVLAGAWVACVYGVAQKLGFDPWVWAGAWGPRIFSTFGNPDFFGAFLAACLPLAATRLLDEELPPWLRAFDAALLPLLAVNAWWTVSAEGGAAIVIQGLVFCAAFPLLFPSRRSWIATGAAAAAVGLFLAGAAVRGSGFGTRLEYDAAFKKFTWRGALALAAERPLTGHGPGSFRVQYPRHRPKEIIRMEARANTETSGPGSMAMDVLAELGVVGAGLTLWLFGALFLGAWRASRAFRAGAADGERLYLAGTTAAVAGLLLSAQVTSLAEYDAAGFMLWPLAGLAAGLAWLARPGRETLVLPVAVAPGARRLLFVPALAAFAWLVLQPLTWFRSDVEHNLGVSYSRQRLWEDALAHYDRVAPGSPAWLMAQYFKGNVLLEAGRPADALVHFAKVEEQAPDYVQLHYVKGLAYSQLGEYAKAADSHRRYAALDPENAKNYERWASAARSAGDLAEARRAIFAALGRDREDPKNWQTLSEIFVAEKRVAAGKRMKGQASRTAKIWVSVPPSEKGW